MNVQRLEKFLSAHDNYEYYESVTFCNGHDF